MLCIKQLLEEDHKYGQNCSQWNFPCTAPSEHSMDIIQMPDSQAKWQVSLDAGSTPSVAHCTWNIKITYKDHKYKIILTYFWKVHDLMSALLPFLTTACMFHSLGPLACFKSELTSKTTDLFRHFGRTSWTGDWTITRPVPTQDSTTHKNVNVHPCPMRDLNPPSQCLSGPRPCLIPCRHWKRPNLISLLSNWLRCLCYC